MDYNMNDNDNITSIIELIKEKEIQKKETLVGQEVLNLLKDGKIQLVSHIDDESIEALLHEIKNITQVGEGVEFTFDSNSLDQPTIFLAKNDGKTPSKKKNSKYSPKPEIPRNEKVTDNEITAFLDKLNSETLLTSKKEIIEKKNAKIIPFKLK